jgi:hypothetical protein
MSMGARLSWLFKCWLKKLGLRLLNSQLKSMRQTLCMVFQPMSLYTAFPIHMDPTNNVWWMRCLSNAHGNQMELIIWMLVVKTWTAFAQLPTKIHETDLLHAPSNVPLPQRFPSIWTQQTMFDDGWDAYSIPIRARWLFF